MTWYLPRTNVPEIEIIRASFFSPNLLGVFQDFFFNDVNLTLPFESLWV